MSGLELMFLDGGATVSAVGAAALGALGYKQKKRDDEELARVEDLETLRGDLREAHAKLTAAHRAVTDTWGVPLSLFGESAAEKAAARGVPVWAVASISKAHRLAEAAVVLGDRADIYEAQLGIATSGGTGLLRAPVEELVQRLEEMAQSLSVHAEFVQSARDAFEKQGQAEPTADEAAPAASAVHCQAERSADASTARDQAEPCADGAAPGASAARGQAEPEADGAAPAASAPPWSAASCSKLAERVEEMPTSILRGRGRLGEILRKQNEGLGWVSAHLGRALLGEPEAEAHRALPSDVRAKLRELRRGDEWERWVAVRALERLSGPAYAEERGPELHSGVRQAVGAALRAAAQREGNDKVVWKEAEKALESFGEPESGRAAQGAEPEPEAGAAPQVAEDRRDA